MPAIQLSYSDWFLSVKKMSDSPELVPNPMVNGGVNTDDADDASSTSANGQQQHTSATNLVSLSLHQLKQLLADR